jgi:hypothetical protein
MVGGRSIGVIRRRGSVSVSWPVQEGVLLMSNRLGRPGQNAVHTQVAACSVVAWWVRVG